MANRRSLKPKPERVYSTLAPRLDAAVFTAPPVCDVAVRINNIKRTINFKAQFVTSYFSHKPEALELPDIPNTQFVISHQS